MIAELDQRVRLPGGEPLAGIRAGQPGQPGAQAESGLLGDEQHLTRSADRVGPGQRNDTAAASAAVVAGHQRATGDRGGIISDLQHRIRRRISLNATN